MSKLLTLIANDLRMVLRDPMLRIFLLLPLLVVGMVQWAIPAIFVAYPAVQEYDYVILMWACLQSSVMFGFINGFVFLEEKDEQVFTALRVMPVAAVTLLTARLALGVIITSIVNVVILQTTDWVSISGTRTVWLAVQYAMLAPLLTLLLAVFAKNKVEGLAHFKVYSLLINLPALIYFLDHPAWHALAIVPTYWSFRSIEALHAGSSFEVFAGVGSVLYLILLWLVLRRFAKQIF